MLILVGVVAYSAGVRDGQDPYYAVSRRIVLIHRYRPIHARYLAGLWIGPASVGRAIGWLAGARAPCIFLKFLEIPLANFEISRISSSPLVSPYQASADILLLLPGLLCVREGFLLYLIQRFLNAKPNSWELAHASAVRPASRRVGSIRRYLRSTHIQHLDLYSAPHFEATTMRTTAIAPLCMAASIDDRHNIVNIVSTFPGVYMVEKWSPDVD